MRKPKLSKRDYKKYFVEKGEPGFSVERNNYIIEKSIQDADKLAKSRKRKWLDKLTERADAVAWYLASRKAEGGYGPEKYFGKRWLAYLRGQQIVSQLKVLEQPFTKYGLIQRLNAAQKKERKVNS